MVPYVTWFIGQLKWQTLSWKGFSLINVLSKIIIIIIKIPEIEFIGLHDFMDCTSLVVKQFFIQSTNRNEKFITVDTCHNAYDLIEILNRQHVWATVIAIPFWWRQARLKLEKSVKLPRNIYQNKN